MDIFQSIILGIVQGVGEFLPISSTAHLVLVPYLFNWEDPGLAFDVALHFGTLVAVVGYFWKDWLYILKASFQNIILNLAYRQAGFKFKISNKFLISDDENFKNKYPSKLLWLLILATIPGALAGYYLEGYAEGALRHPLVIAFMLAFVGIILYLADKYLEHRKEINQITVSDSIIIGIAQAVAIIPGVSRSGATMTAGLMAGLSREGAARFSFLMATPIIFGATISQLPSILRNNFDTTILLVGILSSAVSGYLAISFLLKFIQKFGFAVFVWYRIFLALVILAVYFIV